MIGKNTSSFIVYLPIAHTQVIVTQPYMNCIGFFKQCSCHAHVVEAFWEIFVCILLVIPANSQCCQKWRDHAKVASLDPSVASKNLKWREPAKVEKCGVFWWNHWECLNCGVFSSNCGDFCPNHGIFSFQNFEGVNMPHFWVKNVASLAENVATF